MKIVYEAMNRVIVIMNDLSGGMIRLGEVCNVNMQCRLDNFEVKSYQSLNLAISCKLNGLWMWLS
jgi:hypothetical protein